MFEKLYESIKKPVNGIVSFFQHSTEVEQPFEEKSKVIDRLEINKEEENLSKVEKHLEDERSNYENLYTTNSDIQIFTIADKIFGSVPTNKIQRLQLYRNMERLAELGDAIEEICDATINVNENGQIYTLDINEDIKIDETAKKRLLKSADIFLGFFDFESKMFEYMKKFIIEGEICFENLIDEKNLDLGFVGIQEIENDIFEYCFDLKTNKKVGILINNTKADVLKSSISNMQSNKYYTAIMNTYKLENLSGYEEITKEKALFIPFELLTYIDTGTYNYNKTIVIPILERARRAYNQLQLIEESLIIYRLARAPERLVFNVDVGKMPRDRAMQELYKMMKKYQTKQVYDHENGTVANGYNVHSICENFWFVKSEGGQGTSVETLGGSTNFSIGEMEDLNYFVRKLYLSLKVPFNRYAEPTVNIEKVDSMNYEEFRFAKFVMRLLTRFEKGLKEAIINHWKLKGLINDKLKLKSSDIILKFNPPELFELYIAQRNFEMKTTNYDNFTRLLDNPSTYGFRKYMKMTDDEIKELWEDIERSKLMNAKINFKVNNMEDHGNTEKSKEESNW